MESHINPNLNSDNEDALLHAHLDPSDEEMEDLPPIHLEQRDVEMEDELSDVALPPSDNDTEAIPPVRHSRNTGFRRERVDTPSDDATVNVVDHSSTSGCLVNAPVPDSPGEESDVEESGDPQSNHDDEGLTEKMESMPRPKIPALNSQQNYFEQIVAILKENEQDMESLGFVGPVLDRTPPKEEHFRNASDYAKAVSTAAQEPFTWANLYSHGLQVGKRVHKNTQAGRLDFGGLDSSNYRYRVRKAGGFSFVLYLSFPDTI